MKKKAIVTVLVLSFALCGCGRSYMSQAFGGPGYYGGSGGGGGYSGYDEGNGSGSYGGGGSYQMPSQEEPYEPSIEELLAQSGQGQSAPAAPAEEEPTEGAPVTNNPVEAAPAAEAPAAEPNPALADRPNASDGYGTPKVLSEGDVAPDFTIQTADGGTFTLSDHDNEVVLINFWATWCGPCVGEMPAFQQLNGEGKAVIIGVNCAEDRSTVQSFLSQYGYTYPIGFDDDYRVQNYYPSDGIPYTLVINRGIIHSIFSGASSAEEMYQVYSAAIAECL